MVIKKLRSSMLRKNARKKNKKSTCSKSNNNNREGDMMKGKMTRNMRVEKTKDMERKIVVVIKRGKCNSRMKGYKIRNTLMN
jgi:hypothetical protein